MKTECEHCRAHFEIEDADCGKTFECPYCGTQFVARSMASLKKAFLFKVKLAVVAGVLLLLGVGWFTWRADIAYRMASRCIDEENEVGATKWYQRAADWGHADAQKALEKLGSAD